MSNSRTRQKICKITVLGMMIALLFVFANLHIPQPAGLNITFDMIPVAISAMAVGMAGGAIVGTVFGLISFSQCFGWFNGSILGAELLKINPVLTFVQCVFPRLMVGILVAVIYRMISKRVNFHLCSTIVGFSAAFINTLLFMSSLIILFINTDYLQSMVAGRSIIAFVITSVGINAVVEMIVSTVLTGAVGASLRKAKLI